jgi:O-methyltransferase
MSDRQADLYRRYLDLVEATLARLIYEDDPLPFLDAPTSKPYKRRTRELGRDWPSKAFTMIGRKRLRNFRETIESVISEDVPGDIIETGAWRGGASILARAVLAAAGVTDRKVIVADSFEGLPPPDEEAYPADRGLNFHESPALAVSLEEVQENFRKLDLLDDQVVFLKGWFRDTMPKVASERLAVIRLDGDLYESTILPLNHLYDRLSVGGWVIVDDYHMVRACRTAVRDFLASRSLAPELREIEGMGVYFPKTET